MLLSCIGMHISKKKLTSVTSSWQNYHWDVGIEINFDNIYVFLVTIAALDFLVSFCAFLSFPFMSSFITNQPFMFLLFIHATIQILFISFLRKIWTYLQLVFQSQVSQRGNCHSSLFYPYCLYANLMLTHVGLIFQLNNWSTVIGKKLEDDSMIWAQYVAHLLLV